MSKSLRELIERERPAPDWIIEGFLKRGNTAIMMGQPKKAAKSWLTLSMCWSLAEGNPLWSIHFKDGKPALAPPRPMRCVYFTQEDTDDDFQDRALAHVQGGGRQITDLLHIVPKNLERVFDTDAGKKMVEAEIDDAQRKMGGVDLVAFDPLRRMHHGDENDSSVIGEIWTVLDRIHRRYGCSTFINHHIVKPPMDKSNWDPTDPYIARGSGDIYGGGDAFINVVPGAYKPDEWRNVTLHFESKRAKGLLPAALKVWFTTGKVDYLGPAFQKKQEERGDIHL